LFRRFAVDFAEKYKTTPIQLDDDAKQLLVQYPWPGNVRELKNIAEQASVLSQEKVLSVRELKVFLPERPQYNRLPVLASGAQAAGGEFSNEREILYKLFFDMKKDVTELKKMFLEIVQNPSVNVNNPSFISGLSELDFQEPLQASLMPSTAVVSQTQPVVLQSHHEPMIDNHEEVEESLNIMDVEKDLILKALKKHKGKRKDAATDLGISERTLYRKLKEYDIND
jgi:DNA-binding NtrC family response regulator